MTIEQQIINAALAAVKELYGQEVPEKMVQLQKTKKEFEGNLTLVVFPFLKISRKKPDETAREIGEYIKQNCEAIADFNAGRLPQPRHRQEGVARTAQRDEPEREVRREARH